MRDTFREPVCSELEDCTYSTDVYIATPTWNVLGKEITASCAEVEKGVGMLVALHGVMGSMKKATTISVYNAVKFQRSGNLLMKSRNYACHVVQRGHILSAFTTERNAVHDFIVPVDARFGKLRFYAVLQHALDGDKIWSIVHRMEEVQDGIYAIVRSTVHLLRLSSKVRRAAAVHLCNSDCKVSRGSARIAHAENVLSGGRYKLLPRRGGYSPQMG